MINDETIYLKFRDSYKIFFSQNSKFKIYFLGEHDFKNLYDHANKIVQYGWNKEALPVINEKKSFIAKVFDFFLIKVCNFKKHKLF